MLQPGTILPLDALAADGIVLRMEDDRDRDFIGRLYASTREAEVKASGCSPKFGREFLSDQLRLQTLHINTHFENVARYIVVARRKPIGRFYLHRAGNVVRVLDISLLTQVRGKGIGMRLLAMAQKAAADAGCTLALTVAPANPALRLYERAGFVRIGTMDGMIAMRWSGG